jgi:hypothetical protein
MGEFLQHRIFRSITANAQLALFLAFYIAAAGKFSAGDEIRPISATYFIDVCLIDNLFAIIVE